MKCAFLLLLPFTGLLVACRMMYVQIPTQEVFLLITVWMFPAQLEMWFSVWFVMLGNSQSQAFFIFLHKHCKGYSSSVSMQVILYVDSHSLHEFDDGFYCILILLYLCCDFFALNISWICNIWISALILPVFVCTGPHKKQTCTFSLLIYRTLSFLCLSECAVQLCVQWWTAESHSPSGEK